MAFMLAAGLSFKPSISASQQCWHRQDVSAALANLLMSSAKQTSAFDSAEITPHPEVLLPVRQLGSFATRLSAEIILYLQNRTQLLYLSLFAKQGKLPRA